jgi:nicotinamide mononucleotide transporter
MNTINWMSDNYIELIGAVTGIIYVFLEIRQKIWLWPLGIITSAFYIMVFFTSKFYADMGLQVYYLAISLYGWYWWVKGSERRAQAEGSDRRRSVRGTKQEAENIERRAGSGETVPIYREVRDGFEDDKSIGINAKDGKESEVKIVLPVTRLLLKTGLILTFVFAALFVVMWYILENFTDSPVPGWDSFLTALSLVATWMLARKIFEHWILWIVVDIVSIFVYMSKGLYPTVVLFGVYSAMAFVGYFAWKKTLKER